MYNPQFINRYILIVLTTFFAIIIFLSGTGVAALSTSQLIKEGKLYYTPEEFTNGCKPVYNGDDTKSIVWSFLISNGLSAEQTAGVMGNLAWESGSYELKTDAVEDGGSGPGYGLAQWTGVRRDALERAAEDAGKDPSDLDFQLQYLWEELNTTEKAALISLKKQSTVSEATKSFMLEFERPSEEHLDKRIAYANDYFEEFSGLSPAGVCETAGQPGVYGWDLTGPNSMVYYAQTDTRWADKPFGSSTIEPSGCGPTSVAMVISTLTSSKVTPDKIASDYSTYYVPGSGSKWILFTDAPKEYNLTSTNIEIDFAAAARTLSGGGLVIVSVGEGTFTSEGHIMVMRKVSEDGNTFYFADPFSEEGKTRGDSNEKGYTIDEIVTDGNISNMWSVYAN